MNNIVVESDSHIVINLIKGQMDVPSLIIDHVIYINNLVKSFNNVNLIIILKIKLNSLIDSIIKRTRNSCIPSLHQ